MDGPANKRRKTALPTTRAAPADGARTAGAAVPADTPSGHLAAAAGAARALPPGGSLTAGPDAAAQPSQQAQQTHQQLLQQQLRAVHRRAQEMNHVHARASLLVYEDSIYRTLRNVEPESAGGCSCPMLWPLVSFLLTPEGHRTPNPTHSYAARLDQAAVPAYMWAILVVRACVRACMHAYLP